MPPATEPVFRGVGAALLTFFDPDGEVALPAISAHAVDLVERGVAGVVVGGTTGEAPRLTRAERLSIIEAVRDAVGSEVPLVAGTGAPDVATAIAFTEDALAAGADGLLVHPPGDGDVRAYYAAVAAVAGDVPILGYHYPGPYPPGLPIEMLAELPIAGLKDSEGNADRLLVESRVYGGCVYVGAAPLVHTGGTFGATGAILAIANLLPEACVDAFAGSVEAQQQLLSQHLEVRGGGQAALKAALARTRDIPTAIRA